MLQKRMKVAVYDDVIDSTFEDVYEAMEFADRYAITFHKVPNKGYTGMSITSESGVLLAWKDGRGWHLWDAKNNCEFVEVNKPIKMYENGVLKNSFPSWTMAKKFLEYMPISYIKDYNVTFVDVGRKQQ